MSAPLELAPDNFTPATRTPWGGRRIITTLKRDLVSVSDDTIVGESWEFSLDPAFPSRARVPGGEWQPLGELVGDTSLLVKLLDADDNLSVQVHPRDDYDGLSEGECGKPEIWYVVAAEPGAGIYLGLNDDVTRADLEAALAKGDDLTPMLYFREVSPGDCYVIGPGTVHAVGAGLTLAEPQVVHPGMSGKTYRFWDWNRRYDSTGRRTDTGKPRELHVTDSLAVTDFDGLRGAALADERRQTPRRVASSPAGDLTREHLATLEGLVVERLRGTGDMQAAYPDSDVARCVTVLSGEVTVTTAGGTAVARTGQSLALAPGSGVVAVTGKSVEAMVAWVRR